MTLADFLIAENAYYIKAISEEFYNKFPFLERVRAAVEALPEVQAYYARPGAIKEPFMPPNASIQPKLPW